MLIFVILVYSLLLFSTYKKDAVFIGRTSCIGVGTGVPIVEFMLYFIFFQWVLWVRCPLSSCIFSQLLLSTSMLPVCCSHVFLLIRPAYRCWVVCDLFLLRCLGCDAVQPGSLQMFRRKLVPQSPGRKEVSPSSETSENYQNTRRNISSRADDYVLFLENLHFLCYLCIVSNNNNNNLWEHLKGEWWKYKRRRRIQREITLAMVRSVLLLLLRMY
jgi:hypothetical protein